GGEEHGDWRQKIAEHIGAAIKMRVVDRERISPGMARRQYLAHALAQVGGRGCRRQKRIPVVAVLLERGQPQHRTWQPAPRDLSQRVVSCEPGTPCPPLAE